MAARAPARPTKMTILAGRGVTSRQLPHRALGGVAMTIHAATAEAVERAAAALMHGALVAFPTETVYGLGRGRGEPRRRANASSPPRVAPPTTR